MKTKPILRPASLSNYLVRGVVVAVAYFAVPDISLDATHKRYVKAAPTADLETRTKNSEDKSTGSVENANTTQAEAQAATLHPDHATMLRSPVGTLACPVQDVDEVKVLLALSERRQTLEARENVIAAREQALTKFEAVLDHKLFKLEAAVRNLEAKLNIGEEAQRLRERRVADLVESLSSMSAKKAAPMLSQADTGFVAELLHRLGPARMAGLIALMPPNKAAKLIEEVGRKTQGPMAVDAMDAAQDKASETNEAPPQKASPTKGSP